MDVIKLAIFALLYASAMMHFGGSYLAPPNGSYDTRFTEPSSMITLGSFKERGTRSRKPEIVPNERLRAWELKPAPPCCGLGLKDARHSRSISFRNTVKIRTFRRGAEGAFSSTKFRWLISVMVRVLTAMDVIKLAIFALLYASAMMHFGGS
ncbi:MAG: hypothetical protein ACHQNE_01230 [Candidatus Kapaibacterium sp.]